MSCLKFPSMDPFPPTPQQQAIIAHRDANLLVFAGPGTGKTETLARRFAALVAGGVPAERILVLTFSRRAADEMRDRIILRLRQLGGSPLAVSELFVKTFHGFCARLLEAGSARGRRRDLLTPVKERRLWRAVMASHSLRLTSFDQSAIQSARFATDCLNVIAHLKGQGVGAAQLERLSAGDERLADIAKIYTALEAERVGEDLHDFRDLVNEGVAALSRPDSPPSRFVLEARFAHVLVDEFQDSDRMQLRLLEAMRDLMSPAPLFCFVGDVNQSIYRFRGASPGNVKAAQAAFSCQTLPLRDNRRCPPALLAVANADPRLDAESLTESVDRSKPGQVTLARPRTIDDEVRHVCEAVVRRIAAGTSPGAIAVLLRNTQPYQELILDALKAAGVPVAALPSAGFHEDALVDAVLTAMRLLAAGSDEGLWRRLLTNPILGFRPIDVRLAFDEGRRTGKSDPRTMLHAVAPRGPRPIDEVLRAWKRCCEAYEKARPPDIIETIVEQLDLLRPVREGPVAGFDPDASPLRLDALLGAAGDYEDGASVAEFVAHLDETVGLLADATQPPAQASAGVRVMSIHAAKGLEFDFVVVPQLQDGVLPASERPNPLLPARSLYRLEQAGIGVALGAEDARQEEHSLWYVALTRTKGDVLATVARVDDEGVEIVPSPFVAAKAIVNADDDEAASLTGMYAPAAAGDGRVAVGDGPVRAGDGRVRESRPLDRIRLPMETLGATSVNVFVECPRRFYYREVLRLPVRDDDTTTQYGLALHRILCRFHSIETDFTGVVDPAAAAERYRGALREIVSQELATDAALIGRGPLARFEHDDIARRLDRYAQVLAAEAAREPFAVLGCEVEVTSRFAGVTVRGKADRVDRLRSGGLVIRDYKSGSRKGSLAGAVRKALERAGGGEAIFGDPPEGLNLQTVLYVPGVEQAYGEPVRRLDFLYFRGKGAGRDELIVDSTQLAATGPGDGETLGPEDVSAVEPLIVARMVEMCRSGEMTAFPTAHDESACTFCAFTRICPGPGAVA